MPSYQQISRAGNLITFIVIADNGRSEEETYNLNGELEADLMARVAVHHDDEWVKNEAQEALRLAPIAPMGSLVRMSAVDVSRVRANRA